MSKDPNVEEIIKEFDPIANKEFTEAEKQEQTRQEQELFESEGDSIFISGADATNASSIPTSSLSASALAGGISGDGFIDPITEAIRKEILEKQRDLIRNQLLKENAENPDLKSNFESDEKFRDFLRTLNEDPNKKELYDKALENPELKKGLENIEIAGYKNVHASHSAEVYHENKIKEEQEELLRKYLNNDPAYSEEAKDQEKFRQFLANLNAGERQGLYDKALSDEQFKGQYENIRQEYANKYVGGFRSMQWENQVSAGDLRSTVIKNDAGEEICTLAEKTHKTAPMTVYKQDGTAVTVNSYRTIDFPIDLEGKSGTMHLSLVAQNKEGKSNNALRFTAHYEADPHPDGTPKLKEVSSPQPIKFMGKDENAVGYIEHGGEIYTLPVTRGKYEAMMKEVVVNKGQGVDVSQTIEQDIYGVQGGEKSVSSQQIDPANEKPIETKNTEIPEPQSGIASNQIPPVTPLSSGQKPVVSQMPQPQQAEILQPQPQGIVDAAVGLSQAMQNLLDQLNKDLKNENEPAGLIGEVAEKILGEKEANVDQKQAGINTLAENVLGNKELPEEVRAENVLGNKELPEEVRVEGIGKILDTINNDNVLSEPEKAKLLGGITSVALDQDSLSQAAKKQIVGKITDSALELNTSDVRLQAINGITDAVLDSNLNKDEKGEIFEVISNVIEASKHDAPEKSQLKSDVLDKAREAGILSPEQQQLIQQNLDKIKEKQAAEEQDIYRVQGGEKSVSSQQIDPANEKPIETKNTEIPEPQSGIASNQIPPVTPLSSGQKPVVSQMPQPQQAEILQPQPQGIVDAAVGLSQAMQNLLDQLNKDLKNENEPAGLIGEVAEKILGEKEANVDQKQAGINTLAENVLGNKELPEEVRAENVLGNKELPEEVRVEGIGKILDTINNDNVLSEPEKAKLLGGITSVALDQDSLSQAAKKQIVGKITDSALELNTSDVRLQAINGITDAVLDSNLNKDEKGEIFEVISNVIEASKHDAPEKSQLKSDVLDKAREAGILSPEQQQLIQQNLDKIKEKQVAEEQDIYRVQGGEKSVSSQQIDPANEKPIETKNTEIPEPQSGIASNQIPPVTPLSSGQKPVVSQMPQPQQAEILQPQPQGIVDAAVGLSQAMQNLLDQLNKDLKNENEPAGLIGEVAEKILGEKEANVDQKQAGINTLAENVLGNKELPEEVRAENVLGNKELPEEVRVEGIGKILDTINNDNVLSEPEKAKLLGGITSVALDQDSLSQAAKKQIVGKITDSALELNTSDVRLQAINGITDAVLDSNLNKDEKGEIFEVISNVIEASKHDAPEKSQLKSDVLDKAREAGILSPEQQQLIQQNLDKIKEKQAAEEQDIYRVQGGEKSVSSQQIDPANEKPIETKNTEIPEPQSGIASNQIPPVTPLSSGQKPVVSQMPQPQQAEILQPQPQGIVDAAVGLSQAMQNLLDQLNKDLKNENEPAGLIGEVAEKILGEKEANVDQKQAGINTLAENVLGNKELPEEVRVEGIGKILDTINNDNVLSEPEKAKLLGGITSVALDQDSLSQAAKKQIVGKITDSALELNTSDVRLQAINGITDAVLDSNLNKDEKGEIFEVISNVIEASKHDAPEKSQLKSDVLDKAREAGILSPEQQQLIQQNLDKIKEKQAAEETIKKVNGILYDPLYDAVKKTDAIKTITTDVLDGPAKAEIKGEIVEGITKEVAQSPLSIKDKVGIIEVVGEAIASHKDMSIPEKATIASFAEDGIIKSTAELKDKELMTKGLIDGIHKGIGNESPEITQGVVKSIKANAVPEEKSTLENIANEAILEREMQNLTQGLKGQDLEQDKPEKDIVKAARETMEALGNLNKAAEPGFEKGPVDDTSKQSKEQTEKPIVSEEEKVVQETSSRLNDISQFISKKVNNLRSLLDERRNLKTNEEKKAESEKQAKDLTEKFNEKSSTKDQLDFIQANLIDNKDLSKDARLKAIDNLLQEQVEKRGAAVSGQSQDKTEDVRTLSGKSELKPVSRDEPDIERAKMVVGKDKVNIKDNVAIMAKLTDAKSAIQLENPTISNVKAPNNKKGQSFP
ncbi:Sca4 family spreading effector [Rickettsia bellii]|uniref:Antigenic heat-stable 120 kDa protein n=1 Tax=Rickettsia bellii str. RML An4 TaxID=1359193 RepID=A0A0F3QAL2_RICBE|nr:Sca4 family spreading effector [Rickettsia bellii]KJV89573.1 surface antigen family protein [Rickettsia bellii str. RML An4]